MKFQIIYSSEYAYTEPVRDNLNVLRVRPATTPHQTVDDFTLRVDPETRLHQYRDYFGAEVIEFGVTEPHERISVEARMRVTTSRAGGRPRRARGSRSQRLNIAPRRASSCFRPSRRRRTEPWRSWSRR